MIKVISTEGTDDFSYRRIATVEITHKGIKRKVTATVDLGDKEGTKRQLQLLHTATKQEIDFLDKICTDINME